MFIVNLRFSENKSQASTFMEKHNQWIKKGFDDGIFLMAGSLQSGLGGCIMAHGVSRKDLEDRVTEDPFVAENVVTPEVLEVAPKKADERLNFLLD